MNKRTIFISVPEFDGALVADVGVIRKRVVITIPLLTAAKAKEVHRELVLGGVQLSYSRVKGGKK